MQFTEKMQSAINMQIALEMFSANLYLSMSASYASSGLDGFAHWYYVQYREELEHAEDMMKYSIERGGKVRIQAIPAVETDFATALEIAEKAYAHECRVSSSIEELVRLAAAERDLASQDFFMKYIREQVEEEATASNLVDRLRLAQGAALIFLDKELAERK
nr:ferritin [uncultured Porphyromonas sp.]